MLDRILDKGLVIAGDVRVNLANVELLTIQVRLLICSIDKAEQIGLTWWKRDPMLTGDSATADLARENRMLNDRLEELESKLKRLEGDRDKPRARRKLKAEPAKNPPEAEGRS